MKLVTNATKCDVCLFFHKMCSKMVWKFCDIWKILWELASRWAKFCEISSHSVIYGMYETVTQIRLFLKEKFIAWIFQIFTVHALFYHWYMWATHDKTCFCHATNKGEDQPAHLRSLISAFFVCCLENITPILAKFKLSRLACLCSWAVPGPNPWRQVFLWHGSYCVSHFTCS